MFFFLTVSSRIRVFGEEEEKRRERETQRRRMGRIWVVQTAPDEVPGCCEGFSDPPVVLLWHGHSTP